MTEPRTYEKLEEGTIGDDEHIPSSSVCKDAFSLLRGCPTQLGLALWSTVNFTADVMNAWSIQTSSSLVTEYNLAIAFLILPLVVSMTVSLVLLTKTIGPYRALSFGKILYIALVFLLCAARPDAIVLLNLPSIPRDPKYSRDQVKIMWGTAGLLVVLLQNVPQLCIQSILVSRHDFTEWTIFAFWATVSHIVFQLSHKYAIMGGVLSSLGRSWDLKRAAEAKAKILEVDVVALRTENSEARKTIAELGAQIEILKDSHGKAVSRLAAEEMQIRQLNEDKTILKSELEQVDEQCKQASQLSVSLTHRCDDLTQQTDSLARERDELTTVRIELEGQIAERENSLSNLRNSLDVIMADKNDLEVQLHEKSAEIANFSHLACEAKLAAAIAFHANEVNTSRQQNAAEIARITDLHQAKLNTLQQESNAREQEARTCSVALEEERQIRRELETTISQLQHQMISMANQPRASSSSDSMQASAPVQPANYYSPVQETYQDPSTLGQRRPPSLPNVLSTPVEPSENEPLVVLSGEEGGFPHQLGPFGIESTNLRLDYHNDMCYQVSIVENPDLHVLRGSELDMEGFMFGSASPSSHIALSPKSRKLALIPEEAESFVWCVSFHWIYIYC
jgi:hypothetical protein